MNKDELTIVMLYNKGTRLATIKALEEMKEYIDEDQKELMELTASAISKLMNMTNAQYRELDLYPDF